MKKWLYTIVCCITLMGCGGSKGEVRLSGSLKDIKQGDFLLYSTDGTLSHVDTLKITQEDFDYTTPLQGQGTITIVFPNGSEILVFVEEGRHIKIEGEAGQLKEIKIRGSEENELYTDFRLKHLSTNHDDYLKAVEAFIFEHPTSSVSNHLFQTAFLTAASKYHNSALKCIQELNKKQPQNLSLKKWKEHLTKAHTLQKNQKFPTLTFKIGNNKTIKTSDFIGKTTLIYFWASWIYNSKDTYEIKKCIQQYGTKLAVVNHSLDIDIQQWNNYVKQDSIQWNNSCDTLGWESPIVKQMGLMDIPYYYLMNEKQIIVAHGSNFEKDILPTLHQQLAK